MNDVLPIKKLHKLTLQRFKFNKLNNQIKLFDKSIFNYPNNKKTKQMFWENHSIIKKKFIDDYVNDLLIDSKFSNCRVIHPFLILISYDKIKEYFKKKYCESTDCYELVPNRQLNFRTQTRETLKIISIILSNKIFKNNFPDYYNYLFSDSGVTVEEIIPISSYKNRYIDIKLCLSKSIFIYLEINEKHHDKFKDENRAIEIFIKTNTMPLMYYQNEQDMRNIIPEIYKEIAFSISKKNIYDGLKFYLMMVDNLSPYLVNFMIDNLNKTSIDIKDIKEFLEMLGMENFSKFIKKLITNKFIQDNEIEYPDTDVLLGNITQIGLDKIFMRLDNKYFKNNNIAPHFCSQYSIIKQKYFTTLQDLLLKKDRHLKIILENRNNLYKELINIKPINKIIEEQNSVLTKLISYQTLNNIKEKLNLELHPNFLFLVREDGNIIDKNTFKKVSKTNYHNSEETSDYIVNYRFIKNPEWILIKDFFEK